MLYRLERADASNEIMADRLRVAHHTSGIPVLLSWTGDRLPRWQTSRSLIRIMSWVIRAHRLCTDIPQDSSWAAAEAPGVPDDQDEHTRANTSTAPAGDRTPVASQGSELDLEAARAARWRSCSRSNAVGGESGTGIPTHISATTRQRLLQHPVHRSELHGGQDCIRPGYGGKQSSDSDTVQPRTAT